MKNALRRESQEVSPPRQPAREPLFERLKPGPGLSANEVVANQRARLCGAMVELVAVSGYGGITVRELSRLAGVSTKTFYNCFANVDECFAATHAAIVRSVLGRASLEERDDEARLRGRLRSLFVGLGADPKAAQLVLVESLIAGPGVIDRGRELKALGRLISEEFASAERPVLLRPALARGIVSAALRVVRRRVPDRRSELPATADRFADWILAVRDDRFVQLRGRLDPEFGATVNLRAEGEKGDERRLLLAAVARLCVLEGYAGMTVPAIRREAGVSRRCFDQHFDGVEDCFLAAVEERLATVIQRADREALRAASWERGLVRAVAEVGTNISRDPALARLAMIDILSPGRRGLELRERVITNWAGRLRSTVPDSLGCDEVIAEASIAAGWGIVEAQLAAGRGDRIQMEIPSIAFVALSPLIGSEAAGRAISAELGLIERRRVIKHSA